MSDLVRCYCNAMVYTYTYERKKVHAPKTMQSSYIACIFAIISKVESENVISDYVAIGDEYSPSNAGNKVIIC